MAWVRISFRARYRARTWVMVRFKGRPRVSFRVKFRSRVRVMVRF